MPSAVRAFDEAGCQLFRAGPVQRPWMKFARCWPSIWWPTPYNLRGLVFMRLDDQAMAQKAFAAPPVCAPTTPT